MAKKPVNIEVPGETATTNEHDDLIAAPAAEQTAPEPEQPAPEQPALRTGPQLTAKGWVV